MIIRSLLFCFGLAAASGAALAQTNVSSPAVVVGLALGAEDFARPVACKPGQVCAVVAPAMGLARPVPVVLAPK